MLRPIKFTHKHEFCSHKHWEQNTGQQGRAALLFVYYILVISVAFIRFFDRMPLFQIKVLPDFI